MSADLGSLLQGCTMRGRVAKLVPIVTKALGPNGYRIELDEEALKSIFLRPEIVNLPVMLLSVSGAFRKGKSFLLNFFLRYLRKQGYKATGEWLGTEDIRDGFNWKGGKSPVTDGILIYDEIFIVNSGNQEIAILLMDTQGLFDNSSDKKLSTQIFAFSTLLSSVQVFNLSQQIQENDLEYLQCFTEYARTAQNANAANGPPFQKLMFVIRDWQELDDHEWGLDLDRDHKGNKGYLAGVLSCESKNKEVSQIVSHLHESFSELQCFLMPHPGLKVSVSRKNNNFEGSLKDINEDFLQHVQVLANELLNPRNAVPKRIHGKLITANSLVNYAIACSRCFAEGSLPEPKTMLKSAEEVMHLQAMTKSVEEYSYHLDEVSRKGYLEEGEFKVLDERCTNLALEMFDKATYNSASTSANKMYRTKLLEQIRKRFESFQERNFAKAQEIVREVRESANDLIHQYVWRIEEETKTPLDEHAFKLAHELAMSDTIAKFVSENQRKIGYHDALGVIQKDILFSFNVLRKINQDKRNLHQGSKNANQLKLQNLVSACLEFYKKEMSPFNRKHVDAAVLLGNHTELKEKAVSKYEVGSRDIECKEKGKYEEMLSKKIQAEFREHQFKNQTNEKMLELALNQRHHDLIAQYRFCMCEAMKDNYILPHILEETHQKNENSLIDELICSKEIAEISHDPIRDTTVRRTVENFRTKLRDIYKTLEVANEGNKGIFLKTTAGIRSFFTKRSAKRH